MARIVVVGSVATDEVVRLSERMREGAHLNGRLLGRRLGGGGANTAVALAAAGHHTTLVSAVGDDADGAWLRRELEAARVDTTGLVQVDGPSTRSVCFVDSAGERTIVNLGRAAEAGPPRRLLGLDADLVYVRTRAEGLAALLPAVAARALVVAHIPPLSPGVFPAHVIVGSASDLDLADPLATARNVAGGLLQWMVLTRGADGAEAFAVDGRRLDAPAPKVAAVDSVGAGDAFAAGLCHALAGGRDMDAALAEGCRWGAAKVTVDGSALTREAVARLI